MTRNAIEFTTLFREKYNYIYHPAQIPRMEDNRIDEIIAELRTLRIQVARLESEAAQRRDSRQHLSPRQEQIPVATHGYSIGDRVRILNKIKKPATWDNRIEWSEARARLGTVTEVRAKQIFFTTDNGVETWRAPNNLRKVTGNHE